MYVFILLVLYIQASVTDTFSELDAFLNATNDIVLNVSSYSNHIAYDHINW